MEDELQKINGRRPQKTKKLTKKVKDEKKWRRLKKNEKNGRRPQKKICSQFLLNSGQTFPGIGSAL